MQDTKIQWTKVPGKESGSSWNPFRARNVQTQKSGWMCRKVSQGCKNCYAEALNRRLGNGLDYVRHDQSQVEFYLDQNMLRLPGKSKKNQAYFVNSMTDTFLEAYPDEFLDALFGVIVPQERHVFQVLTKHPDLALEYLEKRNLRLPKHVWMGVTVEEGSEDWRLDVLQRIPSQIRWVSYEPALGRIPWGDEFRFLDWVVVGGESGPHARRMDLSVVSETLTFCKKHGISVFVKQLGSVLSKEFGLKDRKGGDMSEWPEEFRVREFPVKEKTLADVFENGENID